jgi:putative component of toxin-antitoxin plasmid stabilization module
MAQGTCPAAEIGGFTVSFACYVLVVMLGGGDKATQQVDIAAAIALSKTLEN